MRELNKQALIERSIIKTYRKELWAKFSEAISDFDLIKPNDKIAVCLSGGKDSMLLAKLMQELKRHGHISFEVEYLVMDPGYTKKTMQQIEANLKLLGIDAHIYHNHLFKVSTKLNQTNPCYLCAKMRRGYLYRYATDLGCNKIALGHHFDDVIETILMNMFYNGQYGTMMPKLHSAHFKDLELIRPMYYIKEKDIINWAKYNQLHFINCACQVTKKQLGKRAEMKQLIKDLDHTYKEISTNIYNSSTNVLLDTVIGYQVGDKSHSFLDDYETKI